MSFFLYLFLKKKNNNEIINMRNERKRRKINEIK